MTAEVSVIIPAYNRGETVEAAVQSALAQSFSNLEVILVDDGSAEDMRVKLSWLAEQDTRLQILRHPNNLGAQAARNTGIRSALGEWIAFLDSDDRFLPDSLAARLALAHQTRCEVIHSECYVTEDWKDLQLFHTPPLQGKVYRALLSHPGPTFPGILVKKAAMLSIGLLDESIRAYQEWDTAIRLAKQYSFAFLPEPTFIYFIQSCGTISKDPQRGAFGYAQVFRKHFWAILFKAGPRTILHHYRSISRLHRLAFQQNHDPFLSWLSSWFWPFQL